MGKVSEASGFNVSHVNERGGESKELSIPCFRCGVCCTRYQVRLSLVEARQIADELGLDWDEWLDRYVDQRWPGTDSFLLRHCNGACVFLERIESRNVTRCLVQCPLSHPLVESGRLACTGGTVRKDLLSIGD
jgi:hypothetical protein